MTANEKQKAFVQAFLEEGRRTGDYRTAAANALETAGYSPKTSFSTIFESEGVKDIFMDGVNTELAQMIPKLLHSLEAVLDNPALPGAKNVIAAAATLLDRAGVSKVEKIDMEVKTPDGVLILPPKTKDENKDT